MDNPELWGGVEVRFLQPYQCVKNYICGGCGRQIPEGMGHYVVVPNEAPDLRRHWHRGCWQQRQQRLAKRRGGPS